MLAKVLSRGVPNGYVMAIFDDSFRLDDKPGLDLPEEIFEYIALDYGSPADLTDPVWATLRARFEEEGYMHVPEDKWPYTFKDGDGSTHPFRIGAIKLDPEHVAMVRSQRHDMPFPVVVR